ncbi:hypothetical protein WA026_002925 [Henosepilachna vigintioctopunctata]|uniref:Gustatory receptor n=1 Tax=Henosepilachna vigintioctopunctata TaxID=420089 RepID=A0AAW1TN69_9CUCU
MNMSQIEWMNNGEKSTFKLEYILATFSRGKFMLRISNVLNMKYQLLKIKRKLLLEYERRRRSILPVGKRKRNCSWETDRELCILKEVTCCHDQVCDSVDRFVSLFGTHIFAIVFCSFLNILLQVALFTHQILLDENEEDSTVYDLHLLKKLSNCIITIGTLVILTWICADTVDEAKKFTTACSRYINILPMLPDSKVDELVRASLKVLKQQAQSRIFHNFRSLLFANDADSIISALNIVNGIRELKDAMDRVNEWCIENQLVLDNDKTHCLIFETDRANRNYPESITYCNVEVLISETVKFLGVYIDSFMKYHSHVEEINNKLKSVIYALRVLRDQVDIAVLKTYIYIVFIHKNKHYFGRPSNINNTRRMHPFIFPIHSLSLTEKIPMYMGIKLFKSTSKHIEVVLSFIFRKVPLAFSCTA